MLGDKIKPQMEVSSDATDDQLNFIKQMGIDYVHIIFEDNATDYDSVMRFVDRLTAAGLTATDAGNVNIYKNDKIFLNLPGRDEAIDEYNRFNRVLAKAGIHIGYMTWEPNRVLTSRFAVGEHTRGSVARIVDLDELKSRPFTHGRMYTNQEMWDNFSYWWERVEPVCEEIDMRIALHPNDPPVHDLVGICNLITSADDYRHAFEIAHQSPYLGLKMCFGCWLEGGEHFGNLLEDIADSVSHKKVLLVHFRNVSSTLPKFEETLLEDGYMNMYDAMSQLVRYDYDGMVYVDHVPRYPDSVGGTMASFAYSTGYMKGLLHAAQRELNA